MLIKVLTLTEYQLHDWCSATLYSVVQIGGRRCGRDLLNYEHRCRIIAAHAFVVMTHHAVRALQGKHQVAAVRAVVVAADAVPLWHSAQRHGGSVLAHWDTALASVPPQPDKSCYHDENHDHTAREHPREPEFSSRATAGGCLWCL